MQFMYNILILLISISVYCYAQNINICTVQYPNLNITGTVLRYFDTDNYDVCCDSAIALMPGVAAISISPKSGEEGLECTLYSDYECVKFVEGNSTVGFIIETLSTATTVTGSSSTSGATIEPNNTTLAQIESTTTSISIQTSTAKPTACNESNPLPVYIPHPTDCRRYLICLAGNITDDRDCNDGLLFDYLTQTCMLAPEANCAPGATTPTLPPQPTTTMSSRCPGNGYALVPHPYDCRKFFVCVDGLGIETTCPAGQLFDFFTNVCAPEGLATCAPGSSTPLPVTCTPDAINEILPHPYDCRKFLVCNGGQTADYNCPSGQLYDYFSKQCKYAPEVTCFPGATTPYPGGTTPIVTTTTEETTTREPTTNFPTTFIPSIICPETGQAVIPHLNDCSRYILCLNGEEREQRCLYTEIFDMLTLQCQLKTNSDARCYPTATTTVFGATATMAKFNIEILFCSLLFMVLQLEF